MTPHEKAVEAVAKSLGYASDDTWEWLKETRPNRVDALKAEAAEAITAYLASMEAQAWVMVEQPVSTATDTRIAELEAEVERLRKQLAAHLPMADDADEPTDNGWIPWEGGGCPVDGNRHDIQVRFRSGETSGIHYLRAGDRDWAHEGSASDIIAYRVVQP